jgi:hypothetical protein
VSVLNGFVQRRFNTILRSVTSVNIKHATRYNTHRYHQQHSQESALPEVGILLGRTNAALLRLSTVRPTVILIEQALRNHTHRVARRLYRVVPSGWSIRVSHATPAGYRTRVSCSTLTVIWTHAGMRV